jgi:hypothetical protein
MPLPTFRFMNPPERPATGDSLAANGSSIVVANTDTTVSQDEAGVINPWRVASGDADNHEVVRPLQVDGIGLYLNLFHLTVGAIGTPLQVQVFGKVPEPFRQAGNRNWPVDIDVTNFPDEVTEFWIPLIEADEANEYMEFAALTAAAFLDDNSGSISPKRFVYLQGAKEILVCVLQATDADAGLILAQVSG